MAGNGLTIRDVPPGLAPVTFVRGGFQTGAQVHLAGTHTCLPEEIAAWSPAQQQYELGFVYFVPGVLPGSVGAEYGPDGHGLGSVSWRGQPHTTVPALAEFLNCTTDLLIRLIRDGKVRATRKDPTNPRSHFLIPAAEAIKLHDAHGDDLAEAIAHDTGEPRQQGQLRGHQRFDDPDAPPAPEGDPPGHDADFAREFLPTSSHARPEALPDGTTGMGSQAREAIPTRTSPPPRPTAPEPEDVREALPTTASPPLAPPPIPVPMPDTEPAPDEEQPDEHPEVARATDAAFLTGLAASGVGLEEPEPPKRDLSHLVKPRGRGRRRH